MHDFLYKDGENLFITQLYIFKCLKINCDRCDNAFVVIFFKTMYNKCYQPQPSASADNTFLDLDYSGYHKNLIQ